jgi:hypothetical protein
MHMPAKSSGKTGEGYTPEGNTDRIMYILSDGHVINQFLTANPGLSKPGVAAGVHACVKPR